MRRVVSVWFPHWPTDRLRRHLCRLSAEPVATEPWVTALHDGRRRVVTATDQAAAALGLRPGMAMAQALAMLPGLQVHEADPQADAAALRRLALWCQRYTPLTSVCAPDGLWLDITGCAHLFGDEAALLQRLRARLAKDGLQAKAAIADTPGVAHALARHGGGECVVPKGCLAEALAPLPVAALRLAPELEATLHRLGFEQVGHLARIPRALLAHRFGALPGLRLDQAYGRVHEPLVPLAPEQVLQRRTAFLEPLLTAEALQIATAQLVVPLCEEMERTGIGARRLDLLFERVDGQAIGIGIGTARPSRDAQHLIRLLNERLDTVDPGLGIEAMRLIVPLAQSLSWEQQEGRAGKDVARLVDRLTNRLGAEHVYRAAPMESDIPERAIQKVPALDPCPAPSATPDLDPPAARLSAPAASPLVSAVAAPATLAKAFAGRPQEHVRSRSHHLRLVTSVERSGSFALPGTLSAVPAMEPELAPVLPWKSRFMAPDTSSAASGSHASAWPSRLQAPSRLLAPPRPIRALAALPDQPPIAFTWRRHRHRVRRADGPERIYGEWWRIDRETHAVRDYFQVEDQNGQRFWLFREGNGADPSTGTMEWFLHGLF